MSRQLLLMPSPRKWLKFGVSSDNAQVLGVWKHRGNVELYFKHRYQDFNYRIGSLTEYFKLADVEAVWDDLRQMKEKSLEPVELDVLSDNFISSLCSH